MTKAQLIAYINAWIKDNNNKEITAAIMRDVLDKIVQFIDDNVGEVQDLVEGETVIGAINLLFQMFEDLDVVHPINKFEGTNNPNNVPPLAYNVGDLYVRNGNQLFQYNGSSWIRVIDYNSDFDSKLDRGTFAGDADDIIAMIPTGGNLNDYQKRDEKGVANGYAGLDSDSFVPDENVKRKLDRLVNPVSVGSTFNIDWNAGETWLINRTGVLTLTESNIPAEGSTKTITVHIPIGVTVLTKPARWETHIEGEFETGVWNTLVIESITPTITVVELFQRG